MQYRLTRTLSLTLTLTLSLSLSLTLTLTLTLNPNPDQVPSPRGGYDLVAGSPQEASAPYRAALTAHNERVLLLTAAARHEP